MPTVRSVRALAAAAATCAAALALSGCGDDPGAGGQAAVAGFYPLAYVAERVAGEHGEVETLARPGAEPHDLELSPQQVASVADADLLLVESGFQPAVDDAVEQEADGTVVDAADVVDLLSAEDGDGADPHFWLDPQRTATLAEAAGEAYAQTDPGHAADYRRAAGDLVGDLDRLDAAYDAALADCRTRTVVTSHDAFGYLAGAYDLQVESIAGLDPTAEPSPQRLAELADVVRAEQVSTVFAETLVSPDVAQTLADEAGVRVDTLDPIEGLSDETADDDYFSLMRANLDALVQANDC